MSTNFYDLVVVGGDLSGLIAAALCARRGLRVLVTESPDAPAEKLALPGFSLALPRVPLLFTGESSPAIRRVIAELNFVQTLKRRLTPLKPVVQLVLPGGRIDLGDGDGLARELARELPDAVAPVERFLARAAEVSKVLDPVLGQEIAFPPVGFWERREIARWTERLPADDEDLLPGLAAEHPARALVALPAAFLLGLDPRALTATATLRAFDLLRRGAARLDGGTAALRQLLVDKLTTQHAGEVRVVEPVAVPVRWGKARGLEVRGKAGQGGTELVGAAQILSAGPIAELGDLFGDRRPKKLLAQSRAILPTAHRFVLNLVIAEEGIPEGMAAVTLSVVDPSRPLLGDNAFLVLRSEPDAEARVLVTVVANAPAPGDGETLDDVLAALRPRLLERLEELMPFSSRHHLVVHSPNLARPPEGPEAPAGLRPPASLAEPLWTPRERPLLGVAALPYRPGVRAITSGGAQILPGLGLEGAFAVGWCAARVICAAAGKKALPTTELVPAT